MPENSLKELALTYSNYCTLLALLTLCLFSKPIIALAAVTAIDSEGRTVSLDSPARRIVSLAPHITELLFAAGAGEYVVGVTEYSDYPADARKIRLVGSSGRVDMETLLSLKPDLVAVWTTGNATSDIASIKRLGFPIFYSNPRRLEDIPSNLRNLARLTGTEYKASVSIEKFNNKHRRMIERYKGYPKRSVFFQLWHRPIMTVNQDHLIHDVIELCGGRNIFSGLSPLTPVVGVEDVINAKPEFIVSSNVDEADLLAMWQKWPAAGIASKSNLVIVPADLLHRLGPRIINGAEILCRGLNESR